MPDYEFVLWDKNKFDINSVNWVRECCEIKKWALAADYIRLFAVYMEGGIYLDTDVYVLKRFDDLLQYDYFTSFECENQTSIFENIINSDLDNINRVGNITFEAGVFGGIKGHPYLKDCMKWYESHHYRKEIYQKVIATDIYAAVAQKYGFRYKSEAQKLNNNMMILPAGIFGNPTIITKESYAVHWWAGSWLDRNMPLILNKMKRNNIIRKIFGKPPILRIDKRIEECMKNL
jgi:mannosyltransferase OCH1-like enzyme